MKFTATIWGSAIASICFLCTWTFIVPFFMILPVSLPLESIFNQILPNAKYSTIASAVALTLLSISLLILIWYIRKIKNDAAEKQNLNKGFLGFFFALQLFILHPLVFYLWAYLNSQNSGDGQFMFGVLNTFPISSICFAFLGLCIDLVKRKYDKRTHK